MKLFINIVVAGGRDFQDKELLYRTLDDYLLIFPYDVTIIAGGASGADSLAMEYARDRDILFKEFPAKWSKYGKRAGPIRNEEMARFGDILFAFWDGESRGTKNMIDLAYKYMEKENIHIIHY